jgi:hypothetical protein
MSANASLGNESCLPPQGDTTTQVDTPEVAPAEAGEWVWHHNLGSIRNLCSIGMTPRSISGVIMRMLKNHFSEPSLILTPSLRQYIYSDELGKSKIRIVKSVIFDPGASGQYPALVVKRLGSESKRHSMGDRTDTTGDRTSDQMKGITHHSRFITGQHRIFCIADAGGEAEDLAQEVFDFFSFLSSAITSQLPFHNFEVTGMGEDGALNETASQVGIAVDVRYAYEYAWAIQALAPRLKGFNLNSSQQGAF